MSLLKPFAAIGLYFVIALLTGFVFYDFDAVTLTILTDLILAGVGYFYCSKRVFPDDEIARENMGQVGFASYWRLFLFGIAACLVAQFTSSFLFLTFGDALMAEYSSSILSSDWFLSLFLLLAAAPVSEEILMRGIVHTRLRRRFGPVAGILVSSVIFAVLHGTVIHMYTAMLLGVCFGVLYEISRNLRLSIALHICCNVIALVLTGLSVPSVVMQWWVFAGLNCIVFIRLVKILAGMYWDYKYALFMARDSESSRMGGFDNG